MSSSIDKSSFFGGVLVGIILLELIHSQTLLEIVMIIAIGTWIAICSFGYLVFISKISVTQEQEDQWGRKGYCYFLDKAYLEILLFSSWAPNMNNPPTLSSLWDHIKKSSKENDQIELQVNLHKKVLKELKKQDN